jgi:DUF1680 family protein
LTQTTNYPWDGTIKIALECEIDFKKTIALRIPSWCRKISITVNGSDLTPVFKKGYAYIERIWKSDDEIILTLEMAVEKIQSHPYVRHNTEKLALMRGPVVYCIEEEDNGKHLASLSIRPYDKFTAKYDANLLGGCTYLSGPAYRLIKETFGPLLYRPYSPDYEQVKIKAIPYAMWTNRSPGDMIVWINKL